MHDTIGAVMRYTKHYFKKGQLHTYFTLANGTLTPSGDMADYPYIAIVGSAHNDGVYAMNAPLPTTDETFFGTLYYLAPPRAFLQVCEKIHKYTLEHKTSQLKSERFADYSYTRGNDPWEQAFRMALRPFMRMFSDLGGKQHG